MRRMRYILEQVVAEGSGKNARIEGYRIGGKTATSEKLPRSRKKYISSFLGFAPADDPQVIALITIDEPEGIYYGGTIAAPVIRDLFESHFAVSGAWRKEVDYSPKKTYTIEVYKLRNYLCIHRKIS